ncbi:polyphosphate kinase [Acrasis kona]|uniref:Polyphosphate kinase n=1 Tax=Acrasis kona TaxID=1008807 RepID=A0AAW2YHX1_9EUKA
MDDTNNLKNVLDIFEVERGDQNGKFTYDLGRYFNNFAKRKNPSRPRNNIAKQQFINTITKKAPQMDLSPVIVTLSSKKIIPIIVSQEAFLFWIQSGVDTSPTDNMLPFQGIITRRNMLQMSQLPIRTPQIPEQFVWEE